VAYPLNMEQQITQHLQTNNATLEDLQETANSQLTKECNNEAVSQESVNEFAYI